MEPFGYRSRLLRCLVLWHRRLASLLKYGLSLLLGFGVTLSQAQSLYEALASTFEMNPGLIDLRAQVNSAIAQANQNIAQSKFTVVGNANRQSRYIEDGVTALGQRDEFISSSSVSIRITQPLAQGLAGIPNGIRFTENQVRIAGLQYEKGENSIFQQAVNAYLDVLLSEAILGLRVGAVQQQQVLLSQTQSRFEAGEATITDLSLARAEIAQARANFASANATFESSKATFAQVVGGPPGFLQTPPTPVQLPESRSEALARATTSHPDLRLARVNAENAQINISITQARNSFSVSAFADISQSEQDGDWADNPTVSAGVQASVPLFDSGLRSAQVSQAEAGLRSAEAQVRASELAVRSSTIAAWESYQASRQVLTAFNRLVESQRTALNGQQAAFDAGEAVLLDVINARQALLDAQVSRTQADIQSLSAAFAVLAAIGELSVRSLPLEVTPFDAMQTFEALRYNSYYDGFGD